MSNNQRTQNLNHDLIEPQLNIILTTDEDDYRPVYISGNFNNWHTQDSNFVMEKIDDGIYHYKFAPDFSFPNESRVRVPD